MSEAGGSLPARVRGKLLYALGMTCGTLSDAVTSHDALREAAKIQDEILAPDDPELLATRAEVVGDGIARPFDGALEGYARETVRRCERTLGLDDPLTLHARDRLAYYLMSHRRVDGLVEFALETLHRAEVRYRPWEEPLYEARTSMGNIFHATERYLDAYDIVKLNYSSMAKPPGPGPDHYDTIRVQGQLAQQAARLNRLEESRTVRQEVLDKCIRLLGEKHSLTLLHRQCLGIACWDLGRHEEGIARMRQALEAARAELGEADEFTLHTRLTILDLALVTPSDAERAIPELRRIAALLRDQPVEATRDSLLIWAGRMTAFCELWLGRFDSAEATYRGMVGITARRRRDYPDDPSYLKDEFRAMLAYADVIIGPSRFAEARAVAEEVIARIPAGAKDMTDILIEARTLRAAVDMFEGKPEAALLAAGEIERFRQTRNPSAEVIPFTLRLLEADCHFQLGQLDEAERIWRETLPKLPPYLAEFLNRTGMESRLGAIYMARGEYGKAEPLITGGYMKMKDRERETAPCYRPRLAENARRVVDLYERWNKPERAAEWRRKLGIAPGPE